MTHLPHASPRRIRRALLCLVLCCASTAEARGNGDFHGHRGGFHPQNDARASRQMDRAQRQAGPRFQQREMLPGERQPQRPVVPQSPPEGQGRVPVYQPPEPPPAAPVSQPGRLSPDERRALRQQINEAGRDLYRPGRP